MNLTTKILVYMVVAMVLGALINQLVPDNEFVQTYLVGGLFLVGGKIFVSMLKMLVVPVVFCSLITGITGMKDMKEIGRTGGKAFGLYLITTGIAISLALVVAVNAGIGEGFDLTAAGDVSFTGKESPPFTQVLINIASSNMLASMVNANMLQVIFVCILLGIAITLSGESGRAVAGGIGKMNDVMMNLVSIVMSLAPYGVFCLIAKTFSEQGIDLIKPMVGYFGVIVIVLLIHASATFTTLLALAKLNPIIFFKKMRSVMVFAFSTASSNATIPVNLRANEERLGVSNATASFTIPFGATINMDGTAIMQGVATVFIANVYGVDLAMMDYLTVIAMAVLASIGTAGVPGVGLIMLAMVFNQVGLPVEGIALIIGVDRLLDMMRTAVNVTGDAAVTCVVAKSEGELDEKIYNDPNAGVLDDDLKNLKHI